MEGQTTNVRFTKVILDILWLMCVGFPILILFLLVHPYERGFYCNDESLMHPYHESTVPSIYLYIFGLGMNIIVMITTEYLTYAYQRQSVTIGGLITLPYWLWSAYNVLLVFLFGAACSQLTTDVVKYTVGRLRPHFITVCKPSIDCMLQENWHKYHETFQCMSREYSKDARIMKEMRLSFPSGHSSFSMYTMVYFAIYVQSRFTWDGSKLLRHIIQFGAIIAAIFTAMTRISDYKHHWSDVLAGLSLGATVAFVVAKAVSTLFESTAEPVELKTELSNINVHVNNGTPTTVNETR